MEDPPAGRRGRTASGRLPGCELPFRLPVCLGVEVLLVRVSDNENLDSEDRDEGDGIRETNAKFRRTPFAVAEHLGARHNRESTRDNLATAQTYGHTA